MSTQEFKYSIGTKIEIASPRKQSNKALIIAGLLVTLGGVKILKAREINNPNSKIIEFNESTEGKYFHGTSFPCSFRFNCELGDIVTHKSRQLKVVGLGIDASNKKYLKVRYKNKLPFVLFENEIS